MCVLYRVAVFICMDRNMIKRTFIYIRQMETHYENTPIQIYWNFTNKKWKFSD